ncbi:MAG: imelysin family protein [Hyphomicrobium sp.]
MTFTFIRPSHGLTAAVVAAALIVPSATPSRSETAPTTTAVIKTYADIAEAGYADSHASALKLKAAIDRLLATPTEETLAAARQAWRDARVPYMQTEVYRFGNKIVDDWEGKVNAWPLDEGLIDYVAGDYGTESGENAFYAANVIANTTLKVSGKKVDAGKISKELLVRNLHEAGGVEANVATGYHAVEFLLWGQDLNGTGPGAGKRPATDFDLKACTGGNCERRADYLRVATDLLIDNLAWMKGQWSTTGEARKVLSKNGGKDAVSAIFMGLGSLTYGELAGERMQLGLMIHDPEEEHDCFSDNTHASHYYDAVGIRNVYLGSYTRTDGSVVSGSSVSDLVKAKSVDVDSKVRTALDATMARMTALSDRAKGGEAYDQMIGEGNAEGNAVVQGAIDALITQAKSLEGAMGTLGLKGVTFEGSDSLDDPAKVTSEAKKG